MRSKYLIRYISSFEVIICIEKKTFLNNYIVVLKRMCDNCIKRRMSDNSAGVNMSIMYITRFISKLHTVEVIP